MKKWKIFFSYFSKALWIIVFWILFMIYNELSFSLRALNVINHQLSVKTEEFNFENFESFNYSVIKKIKLYLVLLNNQRAFK